MRKLDFIFFDAGGGHRAAATALKLVIEQQRRAWDVRMVNLQELLDPLDVFRKVTGLRLQEIYNALLRRGWTLGVSWMVRFMHGVIRMYHRPAVRLLEEYWKRSDPDLVVSFVPHFNREIAQSLHAIPFMQVITDFADHPPHFWIERESGFVVCGTEQAVRQARAIGLPDSRIFRASGMIIHPRFYERVEIDRAAERRRLELDPARPTGLVMFGGNGAGVMRDIAANLDASGLDLQLILICGRNEKLRAQLQRPKRRIPMYFEGFTTEVPYYMRLSDFFIGKPGPGSISEALAMRLPVIVERNAWTMPHERFNADWVVEHGVGIVVDGFKKGIAAAVERMLEPSALAQFRERAGAIENRAVYEIPEFIERVLNRRDAETQRA